MRKTAMGALWIGALALAVAGCQGRKEHGGQKLEEKEHAGKEHAGVTFQERGGKEHAGTRVAKEHGGKEHAGAGLSE